MKTRIFHVPGKTHQFADLVRRWDRKDLDSLDKIISEVDALVQELSSDTLEWEELNTFSAYLVDEIGLDEEIIEIVEETAVWIEKEKGTLLLSKLTLLVQ